MAIHWLINRSKYADRDLAPVLTAARRRLGVKAPVYTIVRESAGWGTHGQAWQAWPYRRTLYGSRCRAPLTLAAGPIGFVELWIPAPPADADRRARWDPLVMAEHVWDLAIHEYAHVRDYRRGLPHDSEADRRKRHDNRPAERRANNAEYGAKVAGTKTQRQTREDQILALALVMDARRQRADDTRRKD